MTCCMLYKIERSWDKTEECCTSQVTFSYFLQNIMRFPQKPLHTTVSVDKASIVRNAIPNWTFGGESQTHFNFWQTSPHYITSSEAWNVKTHQIKLYDKTRFTTLSISIPCEGCAFCCWAMSLYRLEWKRQDSHICFPSEVGMQNEEYIW